MVTLLDLRKMWLFESLDEREMELISDIVEYRHCPAETTVVQGGSSDRSLFVVYSGSVRIVKEHPEGRESPIAEVLPGQHFGEMSFVDSGLRSATAITNEVTEMLAIEPHRFRRLAEQHPGVAYKVLWSMLRLLCTRLRSADFWLFELMGRGASS